MPNKRIQQKKFIAGIRKELLGKRQHLVDSMRDSVNGIGSNERAADSLDAAFQTVANELASRLAVNEAREIAAIDTALARIDAGTYGLCDNCGTEIPNGRLEVLPYSMTCVGCQRQIDSGRDGRN